MTALFGFSEQLHGRILALGEATWPGYAELRVDPEKPVCDQAEPAAAAAEEDDLDALFDDVGFEEAAPSEASQEAAAKACEERTAAWEATMARIDGKVRAFRKLDHVTATLPEWGRETAPTLLLALFFLGFFTASFRGEHIALRPDHESKLSDSIQAIAAGLVGISALSYAPNAPDALPVLLGAGFLGLAVLHAWRSSKDKHLGLASSVPLWAYLALASALWFYGVERHPSGLAIHVLKLSEHARLYLQVGMFVWVGMMLAQGGTVRRVFDVIRPFRLGPSTLAVVLVALAAVPTAWSGASGIFVLAAGGLIFNELRSAGARPHLAHAATAMSGSLGVVLHPCLLVIIVASLNRDVTTAELFGAGRWVFLGSLGLFALMVLLTRTAPLFGKRDPNAGAESMLAMRQVLVDLGILLAVFGVVWLLSGATLNEHTASWLLPLGLAALLIRDGKPMERVEEASSNTALHLGALLALMALSAAFGGAVERSQMVELIPVLSSPVATMAAMSVGLVLIGMLMDPYGAVILVTATLAGVAKSSGIAPLHFWMTVLVAFELGYLTPPVALNHLLTRSVVGEVPPPVDGNWYRRNEAIALPLVVLGTTLIVVAFAPFFF